MTKKYPTGPIGSHKSLATGEQSRNKPKGTSGKTGFEKKGSDNPGKISKSTG